MNKYRIKYKKKEEARYISHLDFVRCITRTFKRAGLPVKYSQGFNPHMIMTVALPISVGVTSDAEYMEAEFESEVACAEIKKRLNENIPLGLEIVDVAAAGEGDIPLSKVAYAKYSVFAEHIGTAEVDDILKRETVEVDKKTKKGISLTDVKPMISDIRIISETDGKTEYEMLLSAGNIKNLKPETVIAAFEKYGNGYKADFVRVVRRDMYFDEFKPVM